MTLRHLAILAAASLALAGCGKLGALERPGPLMGAKGSGVDAGPEPGRAVRTVDPRNNYDDRPLPPRTVPIDSAPSATSSAPQGALPDPYQTPK
jgi:hypothetical protein